MTEITVSGLRWYQHWWGKILLALGVLIGIIIISLIILTAKYWYKIKRGEGFALKRQIYADFTQLKNAPPATLSADRFRIETTGEPTLGAQNAPVVVVEFIDFKCPNCKRAAPILQQILARYPGKIKLIIRDFPVESTHPGATKLSEIAECAYKQNRFWQIHDLLFSEQETLSESLSANDIAVIAKKGGLNEAGLKSCLTTSATSREVTEDYFAGISFGVRGTPTFFINGHKIEGTIPLNDWDVILKSIK